MCTLRTSPRPISLLGLPEPFATPEKSRAMRAGLVMEKPIGGLATGSLKAILTMTFAPCWLALTDSMVFSWANDRLAALATQTARQPCQKWRAITLERLWLMLIILTLLQF